MHIALFLTSISHAQWSTDPASNLIVGHGITPELASDSAGGCYITYIQQTGMYDRILLERLNRYGYKPWGTNKQIIGALPGQTFAKIAEDDHGGVIVSYVDVLLISPEEPPTERLRVQRVDSSGNFLWGATGVRVSVSETNQGDQAIVSDGTGGCIVAWVDTLGDLRINRIDATGNRMWGDSGRYVWNSPAIPPMVSDGGRGCYIRFGVGRLQRFNLHGNQYWQGPVQVPTSGGTLAVDHAANIYLLGSKLLGIRNGELLFTTNLQKVDTSGSLMWDSLGVVLDTINANNFPRTWGLVHDTGLSTVCWPQRTAGLWDLRTQTVRVDGSTIFAERGVIVSRATSTKGLVGVQLSDSMTTIFVWGDSRTARGMYTQRLDTLGQPLWDTNDVVLNLPEFGEMKITTDGRGGCIGVGSHEFDFSIRALEVNRYGEIGRVITSVEDQASMDVPKRAILFQNFPNPFNSQAIIRYELPRPTQVVLALYDLLGQKVATIASEFQREGMHSAFLHADALSSGTYFYRLTTAESVLTHKLTIIK